MPSVKHLMLRSAPPERVSKSLPSRRRGMRNRTDLGFFAACCGISANSIFPTVSVRRVMLRQPEGVGPSLGFASSAGWLSGRGNWDLVEGDRIVEDQLVEGGFPERGPRGGMILAMDEDIGKKINSSVFPGLQGGPLMHVIAAKAVAFGEALHPSFKLYAKNVVENAKALAETLNSAGFDLVTGGTDTHLMLVDLRKKRLTGKVAETALGRAHITCNKNGIPFDPEKPFVTSGIRLGTPAGTTRGFGIAEFRQVGAMIAEVLDALSQKGVEEDAAVEGHVRDKVKRLVDRFPIYEG